MTQYTEVLTSIARKEVEKYSQFDMRDRQLLGRIREYAASLAIDIPPNLSGYHWSALFTSYCVRVAGAAKDEFAFSARHATYVDESIKNATKSAGLFRGRDPSAYAPKAGDLVCMNRPGGTVTFVEASQSSNFASHSVLALGMTASDVEAARGNNPDGRHDLVRFVRDSSGIIAPLSPGTPLICIVETLK